ncbi:DUF6118 family protein [Mesorhizobium sp. M1163]
MPALLSAAATGWFAPVQQRERQASDLERISAVLAAHNRSAFLRKDQDFRMWIAGGIGLIRGMVLLVAGYAMIGPSIPLRSRN